MFLRTTSQYEHEWSHVNKKQYTDESIIAQYEPMTKIKNYRNRTCNDPSIRHHRYHPLMR